MSKIYPIPEFVVKPQQQTVDEQFPHQVFSCQIFSSRFYKLKDDNYHIVEEAIIHSKTLFVQPTGVAHAGQENVKWPRGLFIWTIQPS